jgi:hypothetical protein
MTGRAFICKFHDHGACRSIEISGVFLASQ